MAGRENEVPKYLRDSIVEPVRTTRPGGEARVYHLTRQQDGVPENEPKAD